MSDEKEYPWYSVVKAEEKITQGDVIFGVAALQPIWPGKKDGIKSDETLGADAVIIDSVVLSQACDIEHGKIDNVILCPVVTKSDFEASRIKNGASKKAIRKELEDIERGYRPSWHLLNRPQVKHAATIPDDYLLVNFNDIYSVPLGYLEDSIASDRLRILPPYREHLSQAFARFFMRVGLPVNIQIAENMKTDGN